MKSAGMWSTDDARLVAYVVFVFISSCVFAKWLMFLKRYLAMIIFDSLWVAKRLKTELIRSASILFCSHLSKGKSGIYSIFKAIFYLNMLSKSWNMLAWALIRLVFLQIETARLKRNCAIEGKQTLLLYFTWITSKQ